MAIKGLLNYARLAFFSKESSDRQLFRLVKKHRILRIVELGIGSLERTAKLIKLAGDNAAHSEVQYTGFDSFDLREEGEPSLSLIAAHRELIQCEASVRLTPGGPASGLSSKANSLSDTDLLLISPAVSDAILEPLWFYLPRMCHPGTLVLRQVSASVEGEADAEWVSISLEEVNRLGRPTERRLVA